VLRFRLVEDINMDAQALEHEARNAQDRLTKAAAPLQAAWQRLFLELPFAILCETMRFAARRLQAQSDFIAGLETCHSVPEVIDSQSRFVRSAVGDYGSETSKIINDVRDTVSKAA
jgi:hypothetical protein